uniref:Uncharacterized protein n=1 Tax=Clastoptera arizonana TaxID=38151 RepID=A0A1B6CN46_9HEMI
MVVHRGTTWDSSDTSHRPTLVAINQNTMVTINKDTAPIHKSSTNLPAQNSESQETMVEWKNTFNMRQILLNHLSSGQRTNTHSLNRHTHPPLSRFRNRTITNAVKSLDILRQNLQTSINKEIDAVIKKYLETFFRPAVENVRNNLGPGSVSEEHIRDVCRAMLEEAKQMYCGPLSRGSSPFSDSETMSLIDCRLRRTHSPLLRKRKESDTDSDASQTIQRRRTLRPLGMLASQGEKLDPSRIAKDTLFIMGSKANKLLGLGHVLGKVRLYIKHPQLFKYCCDQEDQDWLSSHKINIIALSSSKSYIMLLEEIRDLTNTDEYRNSPNVLTHELKGFEVPEFMLKKIKAFINNQVKVLEDVVTQDCTETNNDLYDYMHQVSVNLGVECVSSTMTPPATVMDSDPSTPSEALDLLDLPPQQSPYLNIQEDCSQGNHSTIADSHTTLSALLGSSSQGASNNDNPED